MCVDVAVALVVLFVLLFLYFLGGSWLSSIAVNVLANEPTPRSAFRNQGAVMWTLEAGLNL